MSLFALVTAGVSCADVTAPVAVETSPLTIRSTTFPEIAVAQYWTTFGAQQGATILAGTKADWVRANTSNSETSVGSDVNYFAV